MEKLQSFLERLNHEQNISLNDIPEIDLYMDQVIQLFENKFNGTRRNEDEKILTKTMINNYAKGKLLFPIKNKKYSKEHIILISLIYQLKGALSIKDIQATLQGIHEQATEGNLDIFYERYLQESEENIDSIKEDVNTRMEKSIIEDDEYLSKVLLIASLANMSNLYRRAAEKLVDDIVMGEVE
ncbi:DUF1836 domain-containing protein [Bacillus sp. AGMB 02131]|uniref:DUF1836 domain-containing protein n=1 Tax=Peribacillus faecalis TaxID=2772559 RepID=A0A927CWC6_9BACI|nr:DUF1836 domain-containing protein [Peribacillus faecalis]MBD3108281.1 DUF1836 domain-containing protein [Peribacillus faecalis]